MRLRSYSGHARGLGRGGGRQERGKALKVLNWLLEVSTHASMPAVRTKPQAWQHTCARNALSPRPELESTRLGQGKATFSLVLGSGTGPGQVQWRGLHRVLVDHLGLMTNAAETSNVPPPLVDRCSNYA